MVVLIYGGTKLMSYLDQRHERKQAVKKDAGTASENDRADE